MPTYGRYSSNQRQMERLDNHFPDKAFKTSMLKCWFLCMTLAYFFLNPPSHPVRLLSLLTHLWVLVFDFRKVTFLLSQVTGWYHSTNDEFVQLGGLCNVVFSPLKAISEKKSQSIEMIQSYYECYWIQCNLIWTFFFTFALESWISPCTTCTAFAYKNSLFQQIWTPIIIAEVFVWLSVSWLY